MIRTTTLFLAALSLGACASQIGYHAGDLAEANARFGETVRNNIAVQTVNPEGSSADVTASDARVARAVQAYSADKVEKPAPPGTLTIRSNESAGGQPAAK
jgi:hypothetical protein